MWGKHGKEGQRSGMGLQEEEWGRRGRGGEGTSDCVVPRGRHMPQMNKRLLLLGEGGGRRGERTGDNPGGRVVDNTVVDVSGVVHGRGCIHRREVVEGGDHGIRHAAGREAWGRGGTGKAVEDGGVTYGGKLWGTTTITTTTKNTSKNRGTLDM